MLTATVVEEVGIEVIPFVAKYEAPNRVLYKVLFNDPGNLREGSKVEGTIISVFNNGGRPTYRVRLDVKWNALVCNMPPDQHIVVGNVFESHLSPLASISEE